MRTEARSPSLANSRSLLCEVQQIVPENILLAGAAFLLMVKEVIEMGRTHKAGTNVQGQSSHLRMQKNVLIFF